MVDGLIPHAFSLRQRFGHRWFPPKFAGKPRLKKISGGWQCSNGALTTNGADPRVAYQLWVEYAMKIEAGMVRH